MSGKTPWWALVAGAFMFMLLASSLLQAVRDLFTYAVILVLIVAIARLVYVIRHERAVAERRAARARLERRGPRRQGAMLLGGLDAATYPSAREPRRREWRTQS
ncbi:hypothetical protein AB0H76_15615 [Nocardia sp. NPDC050712]|uniref:hypothetical protein n=1 Tax=Nocardia sp. NPDC050712 TaxID=3155518 RepID=UPI0033EAE3BA